MWLDLGCPIWSSRGRHDHQIPTDTTRCIMDPDAFRKRITEDEDVRKIWSDCEVVLSTAFSFSTFYRLASDGAYINYYDIPRSSRQEYKRLKIFSDKV